jgi:pimeloyl-ACP methyl ester carboxylesterase
MGGKTAMHFAVKFPEKTNSLIIVDIAPRTYRTSHDEILDALCALNVRKFSSRKEVDEALSRKIREETVRQFLLTNLKRDDEGKFFWRINLKALRRNYGEIVKGLHTQRVFSKPTLFIAGGKSSYVTTKDWNLIRRIFPNSKGMVIAQAGHWVHAEAPEEFSKTVLDFLKKQ